MSNNRDHFVGIGTGEAIEATDPPKGRSESNCSEGCLLLLGLTAIALDPLFFYMPMMKNMSTCLGLDKPLMIIVVTFRTAVDVLHDSFWWNKSCYISNREVANNDDAKRKRYPCKDRLRQIIKWFESFKITVPEGRSGIPSRVIAVLASLPFLQVVVFALRLQSGLMTWLMVGVPCQIIPRFLRVYPAYYAVATTFNFYEWICGAVNLLLFLIAGHALGGLWYFRAVRRKMDFMVKACQGHPQCTTSLYCESGYHADNGFINVTHALQPRSNATTPPESGYGIYSNTVMSNVIESTDIISKVTYGFWWGISNLCSMGQNLELGDYIWDTLFAILISILGLFLFALLIGNLQIYMQSKIPKLVKEKKEIETLKEEVGKEKEVLETMKEEVRKEKEVLETLKEEVGKEKEVLETLKEEFGKEKEVLEKEKKEFETVNEELEKLKEGLEKEKGKKVKEKREALETWPSLVTLPKGLRIQVLSRYLYVWQEVSEINLESFLNNAPSELRKKLKPFFCEKLFNKLKKFDELKEEIKKELRERARPVVFQARTNIHKEGFPFYEMIHIVHGRVLAYNNDDVKQTLPATELDKDDSFGEELLQKALGSPLPILPVAAQTIQSVTEVEAFVLSFRDFATVFTKYGKFIEPYKKLWAANVIKRAYRKYVVKTKLFVISNRQSNS